VDPTKISNCNFTEYAASPLSWQLEQPGGGAVSFLLETHSYLKMGAFHKVYKAWEQVRDAFAKGSCQ
jgi:hypothetical protein